MGSLPGFITRALTTHLVFKFGQHRLSADNGLQNVEALRGSTGEGFMGSLGLPGFYPSAIPVVREYHDDKDSVSVRVVSLKLVKN